MNLNLEVFGDRQVSRELLRFGDRATDMRPAFEDLADDFLDVENQQFSSQGMFSGGWRPLAASTIERKRRAGLDLRILHATHAMRNALTHKGAKGGVRRIRADEMFVGVDVRSKKGYPYPKAHQLGRGVPKRRPVEFNEVIRKRWMKRLQRHIIEAWRGRL